MRGLTPDRCASLEHALDSFEDRLRERETDLAQSSRQSADLVKQLDQPFEHEEKLAAAIKRQQQIVAAFDITKNQASAKVDEGISIPSTRARQLRDEGMRNKTATRRT